MLKEATNGAMVELDLHLASFNQRIEIYYIELQS